MPDIAGTSRAQSDFLRKLAQAGGHLTVDQWPSALLLRRWLRKPAFRAALNSLRHALDFRAACTLSATADFAAGAVQSLATQASEAANPDMLHDALSSLATVTRIADKIHRPPPDKADPCSALLSP